MSIPVVLNQSKSLHTDETMKTSLPTYFKLCVVEFYCTSQRQTFIIGKTINCTGSKHLNMSRVWENGYSSRALAGKCQQYTKGIFGTISWHATALFKREVLYSHLYFTENSQSCWLQKTRRGTHKQDQWFQRRFRKSMRSKRMKSQLLGCFVPWKLHIETASPVNRSDCWQNRGDPRTQKFRNLTVRRKQPWLEPLKRSKNAMIHFFSNKDKQNNAKIKWIMIS